MASATPDCSDRDMRGIRMTKPQTYVVRACVNGLQRHVGTFRTYEEALRARDAGLRARPRASTATVAKRIKRNGVYERFTATGKVFDVVKYTNGHYCWGGRHKTRDDAEQAHARLALTETQTAANDTAQATDHTTNEHGISIRFNQGRRNAVGPPRPVYIARTYKKGGRHLGTFQTLGEARLAVTQAEAAAV